jgi:cytochrome c
VAAKYKGQPDAAARLADKVRKGSAGTWGKLPMAPVPADKIGDADLKALVTWVLKTR